MPMTKKVADLITWSRILLTLLVIYLGVWWGPDALPAAACLLLTDWTGDLVDGVLARRHVFPHQTWIGLHDLQVDMFFALGLLVYLVGAGYLLPAFAVIYVLCWLLVFQRWGLHRSLGMLCQAPIYLTFFLVTAAHARPFAWAIALWILTVLIVTWPRFPQQIVPEFLNGMRDAWGKGRQRFP
ncbi:MAG: CDP-alcohol phosphatidyltransferase family protein [Candidatus Promineifilaceae bacterium]